MKTLFFIFSALIFGTSFARADGDFFRAELSTMILMHDLRLDENTTAQVTSLRTQPAGNFDHVELTISHPGVGDIRLFLTGPRGFMKSARPMASLFVSAGFFTGRGSVAMIGDQDNRVLIGFEYPYHIEDLRRDPAAALQFLRKTPGQIALTLKWLSRQPWIDAQRMAGMGVSLGGLFLPASLHMAQKMGVSLRQTVLAFSGAQIAPVMETLLRDQFAPQVVHEMVHLATNLTAPLDPKLHAPYLRGAFLTIRADQDQVFPIESADKLDELLPSPKQRRMVHGPHIDVSQPAVIAQTRAIVTGWLE